jgi:uncharacterized caspase-like protein
MLFEPLIDSGRYVAVLILLLSLVFLSDGSAVLLGQIGDAAPGERNIGVDPARLAAPVADAVGEAARKWAVIVGVDGYLDERIPALRYGDADANLVARTLVERGGFSAKHVIVLTDKQTKPHLLPLAENIDKQIAYVNCRRDQLEKTSLSTARLRKMLEGGQAAHKLLVLGCCHAGAERQADADSGASGEELGIAFREARGTITLASCRAQQVSLEWDAVGQGVFTHFFAQALTGIADIDRNGIVDSDEVYTYVLEAGPGNQQPCFR